MRATLTDAMLLRYAGRFVWLELNFDAPANQAFIARNGVTYTPSFFILDPADEHALATQLGAMNLRELLAFLDRGESGFLAKEKTPANAALAEGDALLGRGESRGAAEKYGEALRLGGRSWPERDHALGSFTWSLMLNRQSQMCAETAAAEAPAMARGQAFGRVVLAGLACIDQAEPSRWADAARSALEPLAAEAIALPATVRDHRFQLYQQLMSAAKTRGDSKTVTKWGELWLRELDATHPANDDERSALDVARVDAASIMGDPERVLPALIVSERAMRTNYNASLRLAQMEIDAKKYDEAIAACNRGLAHVSGPIGRTWLLQTKADALIHKNNFSAAYRVLEDALRAAKAVGVKQTRDRNVEKVMESIRGVEGRLYPHE
jgi:tetratricopeptide (TPR) repeat protein